MFRDLSISGKIQLVFHQVSRQKISAGQHPGHEDGLGNINSGKSDFIAADRGGIDTEDDLYAAVEGVQNRADAIIQGDADQDTVVFRQGAAQRDHRKIQHEAG